MKNLQMKTYTPLFLILFFIGCKGNSQETKQQKTKTYAVVKTDAEWKAELPEMTYYVLRKAGTERAFSGPLNNNKKEGVYVCAGCQSPLYESQYKYLTYINFCVNKSLRISRFFVISAKINPREW